MSVGLFLRMLWRESRGSRTRLLFLAACVAVGVAAVVAVAALSASVERGLARRAGELLGGDLVVKARRPLPDVAPHLPAAWADPERVEVCVLSTMARAGGEATLAEVKAVEAVRGRYPLAGRLRTEPAKPLDSLLTDETVLVAPELRETLGLKLGSTLEVGERRFRVAGWVLEEPDAIAFSFSFGPRVLMTRAALDETGLLAFGSRVKYRTRLAWPGGIGRSELAAVKQALLDGLPGGGAHVRVETRVEGQPALRRAVERVRQYIGLVALLSLLVASVGVAQIVSTWLAQSMPATAVLRCLGMRPREVFALYVGHVLSLALVGGLLGAAFGAAVPSWLARVYPALGIAADVDFWPVAPALYGLVLGVSVALLFSLPPLTSVWRVPPARVLRSDAVPLPAPLWVRVSTVGLAVTAVFSAAMLHSRDARIAGGFALGVAVLTSLLWLAARLLLSLLGRLPRTRLSPLLWQGAAALTRPGSGMVGSILALGLGSMVVLGIALVQELLGRELEAVLPEDAPSVFLVDVQPDQWEGVQALARAHGATHLESAPVAMARLRAVDGTPVRELLEKTPGNPNERRRAHWTLTREQRVTWRPRLPEDNRLVAGQLWHEPDVAEISLEEGFAKSLGAQLGSVLTLDVQGVPMDFEVTSLRTVEWRSFSMNFFLVAEPGVLERAPHFVLGGVRLPERRETDFQNALSARYPNVTVLRVRELVAQVSALLAQVALAVRLLGSFAVLTGLITLAGAVAASQLRRGREAALLKTLGITRRQVGAMFAVEYALSGVVAGLVGALGAYLLAHQFGERVLEVRSLPSLGLAAGAVLITAGLSVVCGLLASLRALKIPPLEVFRQPE